MLFDALQTVVSGGTLSREDARGLIRGIMSGDANELEVAALLAALATRGETLDELTGAAEAMRELALALPAATDEVIDTCGTGGDASGSFNISTAAALVIAGAGVPVAKHGNRAASSRCGSADVLEALGVNLDVAPERMVQALDEVGLCFLFARACHPAMAKVAPIRTALKIRTVFNRLGPLAHPMRVKRQLVGVAMRQWMMPMFEALKNLGATAVWVVRGEDGLDEISLSAKTEVISLMQGRVEEFEIEPRRYFGSADPEDLKGGDAAENATILRGVLAGEPGARRNVVLLNAGAALVVSGRAKSLDEGIEQAAAAIDTGHAADKLRSWVEFLDA